MRNGSIEPFPIGRFYATNSGCRSSPQGTSMFEIKTEFLFTLSLEFDINILGDTPYGIRRIARHTTGSFEGPKLNGNVLPGGGAWMILRRDDVLEIEVRITLETD